MNPIPDTASQNATLTIPEPQPPPLNQIAIPIKSIRPLTPQSPQTMNQSSSETENQVFNYSQSPTPTNSNGNPETSSEHLRSWDQTHNQSSLNNPNIIPIHNHHEIFQKEEKRKLQEKTKKKLDLIKDIGNPVKNFIYRQKNHIQLDKSTAVSSGNKHPKDFQMIGQKSIHQQLNTEQSNQQEKKLNRFPLRKSNLDQDKAKILKDKIQIAEKDQKLSMEKFDQLKTSNLRRYHNTRKIFNDISEKNVYIEYSIFNMQRNTIGVFKFDDNVTKQFIKKNHDKYEHAMKQRTSASFGGTTRDCWNRGFDSQDESLTQKMFGIDQSDSMFDDFEDQKDANKPSYCPLDSVNNYQNLTMRDKLNFLKDKPDYHEMQAKPFPKLKSSSTPHQKNRRSSGDEVKIEGGFKYQKTQKQVPNDLCNPFYKKLNMYKGDDYTYYLPSDSKIIKHQQRQRENGYDSDFKNKNIDKSLYLETAWNDPLGKTTIKSVKSKPDPETGKASSNVFNYGDPSNGHQLQEAIVKSHDDWFPKSFGYKSENNRQPLFFKKNKTHQKAENDKTVPNKTATTGNFHKNKVHELDKTHDYVQKIKGTNNLIPLFIQADTRTDVIMPRNSRIASYSAETNNLNLLVEDNSIDLYKTFDYSNINGSIISDIKNSLAEYNDGKFNSARKDRGNDRNRKESKGTDSNADKKNNTGDGFYKKKSQNYIGGDVSVKVDNKSERIDVGKERLVQDKTDQKKPSILKKKEPPVYKKEDFINAQLSSKEKKEKYMECLGISRKTGSFKPKIANCGKIKNIGPMQATAHQYRQAREKQKMEDQKEFLLNPDKYLNARGMQMSAEHLARFKASQRISKKNTKINSSTKGKIHQSEMCEFDSNGSIYIRPYKNRIMGEDNNINGFYDEDGMYHSENQSISLRDHFPGPYGEGGNVNSPFREKFHRRGSLGPNIHQSPKPSKGRIINEGQNLANSLDKSALEGALREYNMQHYLKNRTDGNYNELVTSLRSVSYSPHQRRLRKIMAKGRATMFDEFFNYEQLVQRFEHNQNLIKRTPKEDQVKIDDLRSMYSKSARHSRDKLKEYEMTKMEEDWENEMDAQLRKQMLDEIKAKKEQALEEAGENFRNGQDSDKKEYMKPKELEVEMDKIQHMLCE